MWPRLLLQISYKELALQHLIVALAALDEATHVHGQCHESSARTSTLYQFSLKQYSTATQHLHAGLEHMDSSVVLTSHLLIAFLEKWLNDHQNAEQGAIAAAHFLQFHQARGQFSNGLSDPESLCEALAQLVIRELAEFSSSRPIFIHKSQSLSYPIPEPVSRFEAFHNAAQHLQSISDHVLMAFGQEQLQRPALDKAQLVFTVQQSLLHWHKPFSELRHHILKLNDLFQIREVLFLEMRYQFYLIACRTFLMPTEEALDVCRQEFEDVVVICSKILDVENAIAPRNNSNSQRWVGPDSGIVMALHIVSLLCRNPSIRRRAITLLYCCKRVEGNFAGDALAIVSEHVMLLEEARAGFTECGKDLPQGCRIQLLSTHYDVITNTNALVSSAPDPETHFSNISHDISAQEPLRAKIDICWRAVADNDKLNQTLTIFLDAYHSKSFIPSRNVHWWPIESTCPLLETVLSPDDCRQDGPHLGIDAFQDVYNFSFEALWTLTILRTGSRRGRNTEIVSRHSLELV